MYKTCCLVVALITLFGLIFNNSVFAQSQNLEVEEILLHGLKNNDNSDYRRNHFQEQVRNLYGIEPPEDKDILLVDDFGFLIDEALGIDFPKDIKERLLTYQYSMLKQKSSLDILYKEGLLREEMYVEKLSYVVEKNLSRSADLLTDEEFETLFGIKKIDIEGVFYGLANIGRLDNEKIIDKRRKK